MIITVDGHFLPEEPSLLLDEGRFQKVKAIVGVNKNCGSVALWRLHFKAAGQQIDHPLIQRAVDKSILFQNGENERLRRAILSKYTNHADPDSPQNIEVNWQRLLGDSCSLRPRSKLPSLWLTQGCPSFFHCFTHRAMRCKMKNPTEFARVTRSPIHLENLF